MNCVQFERVLPEYLEGAHTTEQQAHLSSCPICAGLLADLNLIASSAPALQEIEEPSPRVWNALEAQLRREGLIRSASAPQSPSFNIFSRWRAAWLLPVAAALMIAAGVKLYHPTRAGDTSPLAKQAPAAAPITPARRASGHQVSIDDQKWLSAVASRPPAQVASYRADMENANAFIRDAEESVRNDPNDAYSQQLLINAYEQKQMLYDLMVDRSYGEQ